MTPCRAILLLVLLCAAAPAWSAPSPDSQVCPAARLDRKALRPGRDGWIFALRDFQTAFPLNARATNSFRRLSEALSAKGQTLVLFVAPPRGLLSAAHIDPAEMPLDYTFAQAQDGYTAFLSALQQTGPRAVGVLTAPETMPYYQSDDTHWTRAGAALSADAVAQAIKSLPFYARLPKKNFASQPTGRVRKKQGLYAQALKKLCGVDTAPTAYPEWSTEETATGLLDAQPAPSIALVGTSFSAGERRYGFQGALKTSLGLDILDASLTGSGFGTSAARYLSSDAYRTQPPRVIVWEFLSSHNPDSRTARIAWRQMIPAVYGDCGTQAVAHWSGALAAGASSIFTDLNDIKRKGAYLSLSVQDPTARHLTLELAYADGKQEKADLSRSARAPHDGHYFFETRSAALHAVRIITDTPAARAELRLCPAPAQQGQ